MLVLTCRGASALLICSVVLCQSSCESSAELPNDTATESEHFVLHTWRDDLVCAGTIEALEANFAAVQGILGFEWPAGRRIHYYLFRDNAEVRLSGICGDKDGACSKETSVYTGLALDRRRLVEAYVAHIGNPKAIYKEGITDLFRCDSTAYYLKEVYAPHPDWRLALFERGPWSGYHTPQVLVRYLLDTVGAQRLLEGYGESNAIAADSFAAEFETLWGISLDEAWNNARNVTYPDDVFTKCPCDGTVIPLGDSATKLRTCDRWDTSTLALFDIAEPSVIAVESRASSDLLQNAPRRCDARLDAGPGIEVQSVRGAWGMTVGAAAPGRYYYQDIDEVRVRTWPEHLFSDCKTTPVIEPNPELHERIGVGPLTDGYSRVRVQLPADYCFTSAGSSPSCSECFDPGSICVLWTPPVTETSQLRRNDAPPVCTQGS